MEVTGGVVEKRRHRRLPVRMGVLGQKIGSLPKHIFSRNTVNICPDGLLVESGHDAVMNAGDLFNIELNVIDMDDASQIDSKVSAYARVVRVMEIQPEQKIYKRQIAFQFCTRPQFDI